MSDYRKEIDEHKFTFSELRLAAGSNPQPYVRLLIFFNKRPDVSEEEFHEWWRTVHADLALSVAGFGGHCMRYVQVSRLYFGNQVGARK